MFFFYIIIIICSFSPAIFGTQSLNPRSRRNTVYVSPFGASLFIWIWRMRKIITDFSVVSYGDICRFKIFI